MRRLCKLAHNEKGSVAIIFAAVLVAVAVLAGMGVDYGRSLGLRADMQQALDAAVLAGVTAESDQRVTRARAFFDAGLGATEAEDLNVVFTNVNKDKLGGTARANIRTTLTGLLGVSKVAVAVEATAEASGGAPVCVLALSKTASQQILFNSGANIDAPLCEVHGKSTANPAAIFNAGTNITTARICLAGTKIIDNGGVHPNTELGCAAVDDPFAGTLPTPGTACTFNNLNYNGGNVTMQPGVYCGWINFNNSPNVTFAPGLYVIKSGGWNVNGGTWTGNGVTFYYADNSKIQFNSAIAATLKPPTSGTYANILMFEAPNLGNSQFIFNDAKDMQLGGLLYLPSREVVFNSGSQLVSKSFTLVADTVILNSTRWKLSPSSPSIAGGSGSRSARLTH